MPVFTSEKYSLQIKCFIFPILFELIYTAWDMQLFANQLWQERARNAPALFSKEPVITRLTQRALATLPPRVGKIAWMPMNVPFRPSFGMKSGVFSCAVTWTRSLGISITSRGMSLLTSWRPSPSCGAEMKLQYGEYRTKRVILEKFDALADDPMLMGACTPLARARLRAEPFLPSPSSPIPSRSSMRRKSLQHSLSRSPLMWRSRQNSVSQCLPSLRLRQSQNPAAPAAVPAAKEQQSLP